MVPAQTPLRFPKIGSRKKKGVAAVICCLFNRANRTGLNCTVAYSVERVCRQPS